MERFRTAELSFNDAVSDLPVVRPKQYDEGAILNYDCEPKNTYQKEMRGNASKLHNHIPMQHTDKTVQKFEFILGKTGDALPDELKPRVRSHTDVISDASYSQNHRIIDGEKVSPTITASFYYFGMNKSEEIHGSGKLF